MSAAKCWSDPYAHWLPLDQMSSGDQGLIPVKLFAGEFVPVVLELDNIEQAQKWWMKIRGTTTRKPLGYVQRNAGSRYLSIQLLREHAREQLKEFDIAGLRWEIGAPYGSTAALYPASESSSLENTGAEIDDTSEGPRSEIGNLEKSKKNKIFGIIDYGCAFANEKFCSLVKGKRSTRVFSIWDQQVRFAEALLPGDTARAAAVKPVAAYQTLRWASTQSNYGYGMETFRVWSETRDGSPNMGMDEFMQQFDSALYGFDDVLCYKYADYEPIQNREATHGTYIMDFAAGLPSPLKNFTSDWAAGETHDQCIEGADIVFVQLPRIFDGDTVSGVLRTFVLDAVMYILRAAENDADVVINLSYGGVAGPHDGSSVVEKAIDDLIRLRKERLKDVTTELVTCAGNSRTSRMHAMKTIPAQSKDSRLLLSVIPDNSTIQFIEFWFDGDAKNIQVDVSRPDGLPAIKNDGHIKVGSGEVIQLFNSSGQAIGQVCAPEKGEKSGYQLLIGLNPTMNCASDEETLSHITPYGQWTINLINSGEQAVQCNAWCERDDPVFGSGHGPRQVKFVEDDTVLATKNNLASGAHTLVVGGIVLTEREFVAEYSGVGPNRQDLTKIADSETYIEDSERVVYAPSEHDLAYWPLAGAGVLGQSKVRYSGTSVASAVVTRALISGMTVQELHKLARPTKIRQAMT